MDDPNYAIFTNKLKAYYSTKGVNLNYIPKIGNEPINLYKLYNVVQALGGVIKVNDFNKWDIVYEEYGLPKSCVNGCFLIKQVYRRYLEAFDKQIKGDNIEVQEDIQQRLNPYKSQFPLSFIYPNHYQIRSNNDTAKFCYAHPSAIVLQSLLSGFPNEEDFAINLIFKVASKECLLDEIKHFPSSKKCLDSFTPSERKEFITIQAFLLGLHHIPKHENFDFIHNLHKGKQITLLSKAKGLLDILIAHLGLYSTESMTLEDKDSSSYTPSYLLCEKKDTFNKFWECSLDEEGITYFISNIKMIVKKVGNLHGITPEFCDFYKPILCYEKEILRLQQIAEIFRNWSFIETNAQIMVKNHLFFKFIFLAIHCTIGNVKTLALDTLANVSKYINLTELPVAEKTFLFRTLDSCTHSPDRLIMVRGLEILGNLCFTTSNLALLSNEFSPPFFSRLLTLLTISDILIICRTLETLYQISFMGEDLANMLASIPGCIETLINFLTLESANLMPKPKKSPFLLAPQVAVNPTLDAGLSLKQAPPHTSLVASTKDFKEKNIANIISQQAPQAKQSPVTPLRMRDIAKLPDNISIPSTHDHSMSEEPKSLVESLTQAKLASRTALAEHFEASRFAEKWFISYYEETDHVCSVLRADVLSSYYVNGRRLNNTFRPLKYTSLCNCIKRAFPSAKYSRKLKQASKQLQVIIHGIRKRTIPLTLEEASKIHATHQNWRKLGRPRTKNRQNSEKRVPTSPPNRADNNITVQRLDVEIKPEAPQSPPVMFVPNHEFPFAQNHCSPPTDHHSSTTTTAKPAASKMTRARSRRFFNYGKVVKRAKLCLNKRLLARRPAKWSLQLRQRLKPPKPNNILNRVSAIAQQPHAPPNAEISGSGFDHRYIRGDQSKHFESPLLQARLLMNNNTSVSSAQVPDPRALLINQQCNITNGFCESDDRLSNSISPQNLTTNTTTPCPIENHQKSRISTPPHSDVATSINDSNAFLPLKHETPYEASGDNCEPEAMELELDELPTYISKANPASPDQACKILSTTPILNGPELGKSPAHLSVVSHTVNGVCARTFLMCRERMANDTVVQQPPEPPDYDAISTPPLPKSQDTGHCGGGDEGDAKNLNHETRGNGTHSLGNGPPPWSGDYEEPPHAIKDDIGKDEMDIDVNDNTGSNQIICNVAPIPILTFPKQPQPEVKPFNANPISQQFAEIKVPPPPLFQLFKCGWANCECTFEKLKTVLSHAYFTHAQKPGGCYWFPCVGRVYRQKLSLATHLQEVHCLPKNLQVIQGPAPTGSCPIPGSINIKDEDVKLEEAEQQQQQPVFNPPDQTALQAIRKHFNTTSAPHLLQYQEDSVTKSIRLIAALILRNLTKNSPRIGKKIVKAHESYLSLNAMNATEASSVLSQILWELNQE